MNNILDTNKLTIIVFPDYTGGNFLLNSLALSDQSVFTDIRVAGQQLRQGLSSKQKLDFLIAQCNKITSDHPWKDLDIVHNYGRNTLFATMNNEQGLFETVGHLPVDLIPYFAFSYELQEVVKQELNFFTTAHHVNQKRELIKIFPNARTITFVNYEEFLAERGKNRFQIDILYPEWQKIRAEHWPNNPPADEQEFEQLDDAIKLNIKQAFPNFYQMSMDGYEWRKKFKKDYDDTINSEQDLIWDVNNYLSEEDTVSGIKTLYDELELPDFNQEYISKYYHAWQSAMKNN